MKWLLVIPLIVLAACLREFVLLRKEARRARH